MFFRKMGKKTASLFGISSFFGHLDATMGSRSFFLFLEAVFSYKWIPWNQTSAEDVEGRAVGCSLGRSAGEMFWYIPFKAL